MCTGTNGRGMKQGKHRGLGLAREGGVSSKVGVLKGLSLSQRLVSSGLLFRGPGALVTHNF